jgi:hypothetical protein
LLSTSDCHKSNLSSYWSHTGYILSVWSPIGHSSSPPAGHRPPSGLLVAPIAAAPVRGLCCQPPTPQLQLELLLVTHRVYSQCLGSPIGHSSSPPAGHPPVRLLRQSLLRQFAVFALNLQLPQLQLEHLLVTHRVYSQCLVSYWSLFSSASWASAGPLVAPIAALPVRCLCSRAPSVAPPSQAHG